MIQSEGLGASRCKSIVIVSYYVIGPNFVEFRLVIDRIRASADHWITRGLPTKEALLVSVVTNNWSDSGDFQFMLVFRSLSIS